LPAPDSRAFRRSIGLFATGVTVVAVQLPDGVLGMTANAVCSLSLEPLMVLVCVDHRARLAGHMAVGRFFTINVLRDDQEVLSRYFAGGWRDLPRPEHRFETWEDAPRLVGALASLRCAVDRICEGGDHWIVIGRVLDLYEADAMQNPLLFFGGHYRRLAPSATPTAPPELWGPWGVSIYYDEWGSSEHDTPTRTTEPPG
jgi:flavin reductase (DIM6/NTAB) family NADH-FMN oxidoreductase RutF